MCTKLFFFFLISFLVIRIQAQEITISGRVIDKETKQPIPGTNIYLSGTLVGASADENGNYSFSTTLQGNYLLVATFVGYRTKKRIIVLEHNTIKTESFELNASISKLQEIVVSASNKEWKKNYSRFKTFFLGGDEFANQTFIENPESIYFKKSDKDKLLNVYSNEPIILNNYALGYRILVDFESILFNSFENTGVYIVYPHFIEMESSSKKQTKIWDKNRKLSYIGSSRHFFKSLVANKVNTNQFTILPDRNVIEENDNPGLIKSLYPENWGNIIGNYSTFRISDINISVSHNLKLDYVGNIEDHNQLSSLDIKNPHSLLLIDKQGILYDPRSVEFFGKWSLDRFAKHLPLDYKPK